MKLPLLFLLLLSAAALTSCSLITTPLKVAGSAASAAISVTGKAVGAGVSRLGSSSSE